MKKLFIACLVVAGTSVTALAQEAPQQPRKWPLVLTAFSEAWAIPSAQLIKNPIHPGVTVGTAYTLRESRRSTLSLNATLGYYYHKNLQHNVHLIASLGY